MKRRILCYFMALIMLVVSFGSYNYSVSNICAYDTMFDEVKCGESAYWSLDATTNSLIIFGTGVIDKYTFPTNINSVIISEGITEIGVGAFRNSTLRTITFPESLITISDSAFWGCEYLSEINLPSSLNNVGTAAFEKCISLKNISINENNSSFSVADDVLYSKDLTELILYPVAKEEPFFEIPETVTNVKSCAFDYNRYIKEIYIPKNLQSFGEGIPFYKAESVERFIVSDYNPFFSDFEGCLYNKNMTTLIKYAIGRCDVTFETISSVTVVEESAFDGAKYLKNITFSDKVSNIKYGALAECKALICVTIMNPNCSIASSILSGTVNNSQLKMYGYTGSTAMKYALNNKIAFETIKEKEISSIEIIKLPKKLIYKLGESINTTGLVLKVLYSDGTYSERSMGFEIFEFESDTLGRKNVTVSYQNKTTSFSVEIVEKMNESVINVNKPFTIDIIEAGQTAYVFFTPAVTAVYNYYAVSDSDTIGYVYDSKNNLLAQNDDGTDSSDFYISYEFEAGVTYRLECKYLFNHEMGSFDIFVENNHYISEPTISVKGCQISDRAEGIRTIYNIDDPDNQVVASGLIYGLFDIDENQLIVDSTNNTVYYYESTDSGKFDSSTYAMTMKLINNSEFYTSKFNVRAYARLTDGSYIYSNAITCTIYDLADDLYKNKKMTSYNGHNYLYENILTIVNKDYTSVSYDCNNTLAK